MRRYCVTDPIPAPDHTQYALFAVVVHLGGFGSGHYVAYVLKGGQWFLCDDEQVRRVTVDEVRGCGAYVLCYARTPAPLMRSSPHARSGQPITSVNPSGRVLHRPPMSPATGSISCR
eukprot:TRINITY_DN1573_c0_g1_i1.p4 TRINITY_DN1573_c0_g1~~TRINITY_DN1573_c0_g1_i1.p4  ORF type:complete len:117 (-),score=9.69 TRINITY_DN1573_c0_g1_i1:32-382(-)